MLTLSSYPWPHTSYLGSFLKSTDTHALHPTNEIQISGVRPQTLFLFLSFKLIGFSSIARVENHKRNIRLFVSLPLIIGIFPMVLGLYWIDSSWWRLHIPIHQHSLMNYCNHLLSDLFMTILSMCTWSYNYSFSTVVNSTEYPLHVQGSAKNIQGWSHGDCSYGLPI